MQPPTRRAAITEPVMAADDSRIPALPLTAHLRAGLQRIRSADLYRVRRVIDGGHGAQIRVNGRDCINFCSRSEEHTSELQSLMRISYAVFCLKKNKTE